MGLMVWQSCRWLVLLALGVMAYIVGQGLSSAIFLPHVDAAVCWLLCFLVGAGLGFLWYNTYPAQVFMGDIGALGLGAALGAVAILVRQEILLFLMGGIFVADCFSNIAGSIIR